LTITGQGRAPTWFSKYGGDAWFVRELSLSDYFDSKVIADAAIKKIKDAWKHNKQAFHIDKRADELRYDAMNYYEAAHIVKEPPAELEARRICESVAIRLANTREFFEVDFKDRLFT
jgi:hypothetical protein